MIDAISIADEIVYGLDWNNLPDTEWQSLNLDRLHDTIAASLSDAYEMGKRDALQPGAGSLVECGISPEVAAILNDPRTSITLLRLSDLFERAELGTSGGDL